MTPESYAVVSPVDQAESRKRRAFADRVVELRVDNDTAYRTLSRSVKAGVKAPRLSYMRKFWQGLESMSRYWDDSADHYYELPPAQLCSGRGVKRQRLDDTPVCHIDGSEPLSGTSTPTSAAMARSSPSKTDLLPTPTPSPERETQAGAGIEDECTPTVSSASNGADHGSRSATVSPEPRSRSRYRGRRTGTGRDMPDQFRADTACAFVEGVAMSFQCCITSPRVLPIVQFGGLKLPVRQTAAVYRMPADRTKARQGRLEGPVLTIQVRPEIEFVDKAGESLEPKARLDLMRELGALLQLAQERRREGKTEARPGVGKWWTSKPRWGGGDGYEPDGEGSAAYIVKATNELLDDIKAQKNGKQVVRKKATPALLWKELKCPSGIWDPKVDYMAIGKAPKSPYDEVGEMLMACVLAIADFAQVFMVSSLNHHLSIVKLTVHQAYADSLVSGVQSETEPTNSRWCSPKLQRSEWFDLFDMQQRVEAFRAVWAVMAYLTRGTGSKAGKVG